MSDSIQLTRPKGLVGQVTLPPDPEYFFLSCLLASLCRDASDLIHFQESHQVNLFRSWFEEVGVEFQEETETIILQGKNFEWRPSFRDTNFNVSQHLLCNILWLEFLLQSQWAQVNFVGDALLLDELDSYLADQPHFDAQFQGEELVILRTQEPKLKAEVIFKKPQPIERNLIILRSLLNSHACTIQEPYALHDSLIPLLSTFGAPANIDRQGTQELSELEKRLARLRGIKTEKRSICSLDETSSLQAKQIRLPADPTMAAALSILGALTPRSDFTLKNVSVNSSRSGVFTAMKRFGYHIESLRRKERQGDAIADIQVKFSRDRLARKLSSETMQAAQSQYPLVCIAACYAEGESIIRDLFLQTPYQQRELHQLAQNLKHTGAEIGEFDEGIVIRGREECDSGDYDGMGYHKITLALYILCLTTHGKSNFYGMEQLEELYPEVVEAIQTLQLQEDTE